MEQCIENFKIEFNKTPDTSINKKTKTNKIWCRFKLRLGIGSNKEIKNEEFWSSHREEQGLYNKKKIKNEEILCKYTLDTPGVYIILSPSNKSVHIGKGISVYERLKNHLTDTFIHSAYREFPPNNTACELLKRTDVELYCCFLESQNEYDYSNTKIDKELLILEGFMMNLMEANGYKVINQRREKGNISELKSNSLFLKNNIINLGDNLFKSDLYHLMSIQMFTNSHYVKGLNYRIDELKEYKRRSRIQIESLKKENIILKNKIKNLEKENL